MMKTSTFINDYPCAFRYPRGVGNLDVLENLDPVEIGKGKLVISGKEIAILNFGARLEICKEACEVLNSKNIYPTLADARFSKPLDTNLIDNLLDNHKYIITIEEGSIGGFSAHVLNYIYNIRRKKTFATVKNIFFPDRFVNHMKPEEQYEEIEMDCNSIIKKISSLYDDKIIDIKNFNFNKNN